MTQDQRAKADGGKTHPLLLQKDMAPALYLIQRVLDYGCEKYERRAWHKVDDERWDDAQRRHQQLIDLGEQHDVESKLPHRAHQIAGLIILFMHELGTDITLDKVKLLGEYAPPPQDHKQEDTAPAQTGDGSKAKWIGAKFAQKGSVVKARYDHTDEHGRVLRMGELYKIKATDDKLVLVENDRGIKSWYSRERFL